MKISNPRTALIAALILVLAGCNACLADGGDYMSNLNAHTSAATVINPDGRIGHISFDISTSWIQQKDFYKYYTPDDASMTFVVKDGEDTSDISNGGFSLIIPGGKNVTIVANYDYVDFHRMLILLNCDKEYYWTYRVYQKSIYIGMNFYSRGVNDITDLVNPDGIPKSFIISPMVGRIFTINAHWDNVNHAATGSLYGLKLAVVMTKNLTIVSSYVLNQTKPFTDQTKPLADHTMSLGFHYHFNNRIQSAESFNPDGSPGMISIAPTIGYILIPENASGYTAGTEITIPIIRYLSSYFRIQYTSIKATNENYGFYFISRYHPALRKSNQLNIGLGVDIHL